MARNPAHGVLASGHQFSVNVWPGQQYIALTVRPPGFDALPELVALSLPQQRYNRRISYREAW